MTTKTEDFYKKSKLLDGIEHTMINKNALITQYDKIRRIYEETQAYDEFELFAIFFTIKRLYHKSIFVFDDNKLIKFICLPENKLKFKGFFYDSKESYPKLGDLIAKSFIKLYNLKSSMSDIVSLFTETSQGTIDVYEHQIENIVSKNSLTVTDRLNKMSEEGWELITIVGHSYFFRRKINRI